jgi:hypothetical protein
VGECAGKIGREEEKGLERKQKADRQQADPSNGFQ